MKRFKDFLNESLDTDAINYILDNDFPEDTVAEMYDDELLNWVDEDWEEESETEYDWYIDHNNGEAQDVIYNNILDNVCIKLGLTLNMDEHCELFDIIKNKYNF